MNITKIIRRAQWRGFNDGMTGAATAGLKLRAWLLPFYRESYNIGATFRSIVGGATCK